MTNEIKKEKLQERWNEFRNVSIPPQASLPQIFEMKRAFYTGAAEAYNLIVNAMQSDDKDWVIQLGRELETYMTELQLVAAAQGKVIINAKG